MPDDCSLFFNDCNSNGVPDDCDLADGTSVDLDWNFNPDECDCYVGHPTNYCVSTRNSWSNIGARMDFGGSQSLLQNDAELFVGGAPPGSFGFFFYGSNQTSLPVGLGFRCVGGQLRRLAGRVVGADGTLYYPLNFDHPSLDLIEPGQTWNFQFLFRDSFNGTVDIDFSDALSVEFCM